MGHLYFSSPVSDSFCSGQSLECFHQSWCGGPQLIAVLMGKLLKERFTLLREMHDDLPAVLAVAGAHDQATALSAINQLHCAVMLKLQALGQKSDRGLIWAGQAANRQQQLILLGMQSDAPRRGLAEVQETAYLVAELGLRDTFCVLFAAG